MKTHPTTHRWGIFLGLMMVLFVTYGAQAQTAEDALRFTERFPATGARMIGMGGAGGAGVADPSAFFTNPAGLGYFRASLVSGSLNTFAVTDDAFAPAFGTAFENDVSATQLGNLAYIYRAPTRQGSLVVGAAFNQISSFERDLFIQGLNNQSSITTTFLPFNDEYGFDVNDNLEFFSEYVRAGFLGGAIEYFPEFFDDNPNAYPFLEAVAPGTTIEQTLSVLEEGRMSELSLGGAAEATRGVMVGVSANLVFGQYDLLHIFEEFDLNDENRPEDYTVIGDNGLLEGFDAFEARQTLETDLVGVNLRAGVSGQVASNVRVGVTIETPTYYEVEEEFTTEYATFFDFGGDLTYGNQSGDTFGNGEFNYEIVTPWRLGAGVGFDAADFSVMADVEFIDWSELELDAEFDRAYFADLNQQISQDYQPVLNFRAGGEYRIDDFALRVGFAYYPDPLDERARGTLSDGVELDRARTFFSAGFGYQFNRNFQLDLGWMQERQDDTFLAYPENRLAPSDPQLQVDEEIVRNRIAVGVKFFF